MFEIVTLFNMAMTNENHIYNYFFTIKKKQRIKKNVER